MENQTTGKPIADELMEILACPICKEKIALEGDRLVCYKCLKAYRIDDGIPVMLIDEAIDISGEARPAGAAAETPAETVAETPAE